MEEARTYVQAQEVPPRRDQLASRDKRRGYGAVTSLGRVCGRLSRGGQVA